MVTEVRGQSRRSSDGDHSPFPGLRPFSEREAALFFGREREVEAILSLLEQQQFVVVHGASGGGKSSVVRAGVVPVFRRDALANSSDGRVIIIRPADAGGPLYSLARKLEKEFPRADASVAPTEANVASEIPADQSWSSLLSASPAWARDIGDAATNAGATLCLIIDQFEEMFALVRAGHTAEVRRVIDFLIGLGEPIPEGTGLGKRSLSVILTMRSDYLGHCSAWDGFAEAVNRCQYLLPKISPVGLLKSIHESARRSNVTVTESVTDRLLAVAGRETDGLPILQHLLMRSWQEANVENGRKVIDIAALDRAGGPGNALSLHANEAYKLTTEGVADGMVTTDWMFRSLSDLDSDGRIIRRSITLARLASEVGKSTGLVRSILDVFRDPSFSLIMPFSPEDLDDETIVSVSHEALLRQWDRIIDTHFDADARPIGLVYREFQDGLVWRALSIQAQAFARDQASVLGAAATEQRLPWFRDIKTRPGWAARHEAVQVYESDADVATRWQQVNDFMDASERNLAKEKNLVQTLRRNQRLLILLSLAVIALAGSTVVSSVLTYREKKHTAAMLVAQADAEKRVAQQALFAEQMRTANEMARRQCVGSNGAGAAMQRCFEDASKKFYADIASGKYSSPGNVEIELPASPYGGGLGNPGAGVQK